MKHAILFIAILAMNFLGLTYAQESTITWGDDINTERKILKIFGENEGGLFALTLKKKDFFIEYCTKPNFKPKFTKKILFKNENGVPSEMGNIFYLDGQIQLFTVAYDKKNKDYNIYGYIMDERANVVGKRVEVMSIDVEKKNRKGKFDFKLSRDRSKLLVIHSAPHKRKEKTWHINMKIMTSSLAILKDIHEEIPLKEDRDVISISDYYIANNAGVYLATQRLDWEKRAFITRELMIYQYDPSNGFDKREISIDLGDKAASSISLTSDKEGNLIGAGFYSERETGGFIKSTGIAGSYFVKINRATGKVIAVNSEPFGTEFTATILKEKKAAKGQLVPNYFAPRKIISTLNGGAVMTAEYHTITISESRGMRTTQHYHGPIIVCYIKPSGEIGWVKSIPKNQSYVKTEMALGAGVIGGGFSLGFQFWIGLSKDKSVYHSYCMGQTKDKLYFLYNDHKTNLEIEHFRDTKLLNGIKNTVPVLISIDGEGSMEKEILPGGEKDQVVIRPKVNFQDDYGKILLYGSRKRMDKFGKIVF